MRLFHFTCDHGAEGIRRDGIVKPQPNPWLGRIAWFTDLENPNEDDVGLTGTMLTCDRLAHRFEVDPSVPHPWVGSMEQAQTPPYLQADLERYGKPGHWFVSRVGVGVRGEIDRLTAMDGETA